MLSSETKVVTYVNKKGERSTYPLNSAMESSNVEMVKRLKYTKDILTHMLNANAGGKQEGGTSRPKTNEGQKLGSSAKFSATDKGPTSAKPYQTSQGFNPKEFEN